MHRSFFSIFQTPFYRCVLFVAFMICAQLCTAQLINISDSVQNNPGNLKGFIHLPRSNSAAISQPRLVVVLHGCAQTAQQIYWDAGWEKLSNLHHFIVLLPQQRLSNNLGRCFNWFYPENYTRHGNEVQSILQQMKWVIKKYNVDTSKVYLYGVSAGGGMATDLLFLYPTRFQGVAILAGASFKAIKQPSGAFHNVVSPEKFSDSLLLSRLPNSLDTTAFFPYTLVLQGDKDNIVKPVHSENLVRQIQLAFHLKQQPTYILSESGEKHPIKRTDYTNKSNDTLLSYFEIHNWGHYLMVHPGKGKNEGGNLSGTSRKGKIWSTLYILHSWGLDIRQN